MENKGDLLLLLANGGDLIRKILVRIVSLLRFKSVSKPWYALIERPSFIDLHATLNNSSSSSSSSFIVLAELDHPYIPEPFTIHVEPFMIMISSSGYDDSVSITTGSGRSSLWSVTGYDYDEELVFKVDNNNLGGGGLVFKLDSLGFPKFCELSKRIDDLGLPQSFKTVPFSKNIVGSCNGLVCIYDGILNEFSLWNPATKHHRILPQVMKIGEEHTPMRLTAFGFDVETKDYKVVLITGLGSNYYRSGAPSMECLCRVQVYSLSTDSWRLLEGITCLPGDPFFSYPTTKMVCVNGSCFFLAYFFNTKHRRCNFRNDRFIISFDLSKYTITPIQLPPHDQRHKLYVNCLGDKMALFIVCCPPLPTGDSYYPDDYELSAAHNRPKMYEPPRGSYQDQICDCEDYNIWVLDEHVSSRSSSVTKESWRHLNLFQIQHQRPCLRSSPSCIWNDAEFVLLENLDIIGWGKKMMLYNLVTKEVKKDFLSCSRVLSQAYAYKPSLVKLMVGSTQQQQPIG